MPRINGPLFSLRASGTIANVLTFRNQRGRQTVQANRTKQNPRTERQIAQREKFANARATWDALTTGEQLSWTTLANRQSLQGFNVFLREYVAQNCTIPTLPRQPNLYPTP